MMINIFLLFKVPRVGRRHVFLYSLYFNNEPNINIDVTFYKEIISQDAYMTRKKWLFMLISVLLYVINYNKSSIID